MRLKVLAEGMTLIEDSGERMYEAELHRLKGELLLMQDVANTVQAERCFSSFEEIVHDPDFTIRRVQSAAPADARRWRQWPRSDRAADSYRMVYRAPRPRHRFNSLSSSRSRGSP